MTQSLADLAASLRAVSTAIDLARTDDPGLERHGTVFGAGTTGRLGTMGDRLHGLWCEAIDARVAEASAMVKRLDETADRILRAAAIYTEADAAAGSTRAEDR